MCVQNNNESCQIKPYNLKYTAQPKTVCCMLKSDSLVKTFKFQPLSHRSEPRSICFCLGNRIISLAATFGVLLGAKHTNLYLANKLILVCCDHQTITDKIIKLSTTLRFKTVIDNLMIFTFQAIAFIQFNIQQTYINYILTEKFIDFSHNYLFLFC